MKPPVRLLRTTPECRRHTGTMKRIRQGVEAVVRSNLTGRLHFPCARSITLMEAWRGDRHIIADICTVGPNSPIPARRAAGC